MKIWMILLAIVIVVAGVLAFSGAVQAAAGALKALFFTAIALLALSAAGAAFIKNKV